MLSVKIIAEAGVNHNGCLETAKKMIKLASDSGADFVKFQTFKAASRVSKSFKSTHAKFYIISAYREHKVR